MAHSLAHDETLSSAAPSDDGLGGQPVDAEFRERLSTYRGFVRGVMLFAGHALAILILLYYFLM
jgi:hypothetical protein